MKLTLLFCAAVIAWSAGTATVTAAPPISAGLSIQRQIANASLTFEIEDGKARRPVLQLAAEPKLTRQADGVQVDAVLTFDEKSGRALWKTSIRNTGNTQRWLTLRWFAGFPASASTRYWGGRGQTKLIRDARAVSPIDADGNTLPLQALYNDERGLALALNPWEIFSEFSQTYDLAKRRMQLEIPLVLDAGQSDSIEIELYSFPAPYGHLDAVQRYYEAHPQAFTARNDVDQRVTGGGAAYVVWRGESPERARRFLADWEWTYSPFKRTGDIYGRPEFWDYKSARPQRPEFVTRTPQQYHELRRQKYAVGLGTDTAMMFYQPSFMYIEEQLANEKYPGAIVRKPDGSYAKHWTTPWVTGPDNEVVVYPWGNDFSRQSQRDIHDLIADKQLNIQGFSYDVLLGGWRHRAAGVAESPRRGFDEHGVYADVSVGLAKMMDFTRDLTKDGRKMALVANPSGGSRMFLTARTDSAMYESPPYRTVGELRDLRLLMGHKTLVWWDDWGLSTYLNWQEMSAEELRQAYLGARDYVLLASFAYGGIPTPRLSEGTPKLVRWLRPLRRVVRAGWQPVTAMRGVDKALPATLMPARYGSGVGSFLVLGNVSPTEFRGTIVVDNAYLGDGNYLFATHDGKPLRQRVQGRTTNLEVSIAPHEPLVLQAVAALDAGATTGDITTSWSFDGAAGTLKLNGLPPTVAVRQTAAPAEECSAPVKAGNDEWKFASQTFAVPSEALLAFPFFDEQRVATIALPAQPTAEEEWAAMRLQEYFRFWGDNGLSPARKIELPIVRGEAASSVTSTGEAATRNGAVIQIGGASPTTAQPVRLINGASPCLVVAGKTPMQTREALISLLNALDVKYFYAGRFPKTGEGAKDEAVVLQKAGLSGGILD